MHTYLKIGLKLKIDYILFQEPFINMDIMTTISHFAYYYIVPESGKIRLRIMIFTKNTS